MLRLARTGEHELEAPPPDLLEQRPGRHERAHLVDHEVELLAPGFAQLLAVALLDLVTGHVRDEVVAAHADAAVQLPERQGDVDAAERPVPGERVLVVRVDEGPVDVEDRGVGHAAVLPAPDAPMRHPEPPSCTTERTASANASGASCGRLCPACGT